MSLVEKIRSVRGSIIAIGYHPESNKVNIIGTGFCISDDGEILTVAHVLSQTPPQFQSQLVGMVMIKTEPTGLEHYSWFPMTLLKKDERNDLALFKLSDHTKTLLKPIELGDSEKVEVGQDVYFIGFPYAAQLANDGFGMTLVANKAMVSNIKVDAVDSSHPRNFIIVDAISNPGNSGCPLIDIETNKVLGVMSIAFRIKSMVPKYSDLDIREPMHIAGAKPINLAKDLL